MQNGNDTTNSCDNTPTFLWSAFFSGHAPTIDELPYRPQLILYSSPTNSNEEDIDLNNFIDIPHGPTNQTTQEVPVITMMEETQNGSQEASNIPV